MTAMPRLLGAALLLVVACAQPAAGPAPTSTVTSGVAPATTRVSGAPTTSMVELALVVDDCSAPQVGFSPLCETFSLIEAHHMDRPIDHSRLAAAAEAGLMDFSTDLVEPPPRTLFCAIPDPVFTSLCELLAQRVRESSIPVADAVEAAVVRMTETGLEPFTYYLPPEQAGSFRANGVVGGVGILLDARDAVGSKCTRITAACPLEIVFVLEDNPGSEAGLVAGDLVVEIDGAPVEGLGFVEAAARIAGDETGIVEMEVERDDQSMELSIPRAPLVVPTVEIGVPSPGVGYLRIPDFEEDIPDLVREGLAELVDWPIDRLVIDLRDNPGGYLDAAVDVASSLIDGGVVVRTEGPGESEEYVASTGGEATGVPVTVVVNGGTASAAEILAAALRDRRGATIVGTPTFGKDAVQIAFDLNNGGELTVAVARWSSPDGATVAGSGIIPDRVMEVPPTLSPAELVELTAP